MATPKPLIVAFVHGLKLEIGSENIVSVPSPVHAGLCSWLLKRVQHDGGGVTAEQPDAQTAPIQSATSAAPWFAASFSARATARGLRSEEHTSELQSLMRISYAVFSLN